MNRIGESLQHFAANVEIIKAFTRFDVDYLLVGGLAVSWYCSTRQADDMDLLVNPTPENSTKITAALNSLGSMASTELSPNSFSKPGIQAPLKHYFYADILTPPCTGPSYEVLAADCVDAQLFGIPVRIPSRACLIRLKEIAATAEKDNRLKHCRDIALLKDEAE